MNSDLKAQLHDLTFTGAKVTSAFYRYRHEVYYTAYVIRCCMSEFFSVQRCPSHLESLQQVTPFCSLSLFPVSVSHLFPGAFSINLARGWECCKLIQWGLGHSVREKTENAFAARYRGSLHQLLSPEVLTNAALPTYVVDHLLRGLRYMA